MIGLIPGCSIEEEEAQQNLVVKVASAAFSFSITINLRLQV
jgi:hypothetical protein